jgi:hypothetical protein
MESTYKAEELIIQKALPEFSEKKNAKRSLFLWRKSRVNMESHILASQRVSMAEKADQHGNVQIYV